MAGATYGGLAEGTLQGAVNGAIVGGSIGASIYGGYSTLSRWGSLAKIATTKGAFGGGPLGTLNMLAHETGYHYLNAWTRDQVTRLAHKNGITLWQLNLGLFGVSALGNSLPGIGSRYYPGDSQMLGVNNRGKFGWAFDAVDVVLEYQGIPSASGVHAVLKPPSSGRLTGHSLGSLTVSNLTALGALSSSAVYSLPFGNVAPVGGVVTNSSGDAINGFFLGNALNPGARLVNGGFLGHDACEVYGVRC